MRTKASKDELNRAADYFATLMRESLEQFPKAEQERRLEAIRHIGLRIGRKAPEKASNYLTGRRRTRATRRVSRPAGARR